MLAGDFHWLASVGSYSVPDFFQFKYLDVRIA